MMVIPIGDENRRGAPRPYVNILFVAINVLVFLYELTLSQTGLESFFLRFGAVPAQIQQRQDLYTLVTSQFIHGGFLHIIGNMFFLWVFGDNIEAALGHLLYAVFYLGAGILAGVTEVLFTLGSTIPAIGASGAIAGVLGAYIVLFPLREIRVLIIVIPTRVTAVAFLGIWALLQLFTGVASLGVPTASGGVAVWAHVGGFVTGVTVGTLGRWIHLQRRG